MLTSLVSLQQGYVKKSEKSTKIVNTEGENLHIFWTNWRISMKVSGRMWLMIILKVTKYQGLSLSLSLSGENTFLEKPQGKVGETITKQSPQIYSRKIYIKEYPLINGAQKCTVVMFISKNPLFVSHSTRPCIEEEPLESPKPWTLHFSKYYLLQDLLWLSRFS